MPAEAIELNHLVVDDFLAYGLCAPGDAFFNLSSPAPPAAELPPPHEFESVSAAAAHLYETLRRAVDEIIRGGQITACALSGGADSRLLLTILRRDHPSQLAQIYFYTRLHPRLSPEEDRDVALACALGRLLEFTVHIEEARFLASGYLIDPRPSPAARTLTGLWGGELLGGQLLSHKLFDIDTLLAAPSHSRVGAVARRLLGERTSPAFAHAREFQLHARLLLDSPYSALYRSLTWFRPALAEASSISPFRQESFVRELLQVPGEFLRDYRLYATLLNAYGDETLELPISNSALPELGRIRQARAGRDPKSLSGILDLPASDVPAHVRVLESYIQDCAHARYAPYLREMLPYLNHQLLGVKMSDPT